jgi:chromosome segregation ATPase
MAREEAESWQKDCQHIKRFLRREIAVNKRLEGKVVRITKRQDALRKERDAVRTELVKTKRELFDADALVRELRGQGSVADRNSERKLASLGKDAKHLLVKMQAHSRRKVTRTKDECQREIAGLKEECARDIKGAKEECARHIAKAKAEHEGQISRRSVADPERDFGQAHSRIIQLNGQLALLTKAAEISNQAMRQLDSDKKQLMVDNDKLRINLNKLRDDLDRLRTSRWDDDSSRRQWRTLVSYADHGTPSTTVLAPSAPEYDRFGSSVVVERSALSGQDTITKPVGNTGVPLGSPNVVSISIRGIGHQIPTSAYRTVMSIAGRGRDFVRPFH